MQPVLFLSHGGGPLPLLGDVGHQDMLGAYAKIKTKLDALPTQPRALVFVSAHWEVGQVQVTSSPNPSLYYDYYGFPDEAYSVQYPVAGAPDIAHDILTLLSESGIEAVSNEQRGLDHGVFVPAKLLFPEADIPCLQISLLNSLDADAHLKLGQALASLRKHNVMLIGSGFSFHNMQAFFGKTTDQQAQLNLQFEDWLSQTLRSPDADERYERLRQWEDAPGARYCHPREEHLLPVHVCAAAADAAIADEWRFVALGRQGSCYWWD